ncbi:MAG: hypothetical protein CVV64_02585 [Candidatus Wallbacteria bacterium HGW-Wallbacteria-1]|jgi:hypothetical protein|uniref:VWFA domain-containing protein n=1 Tax=Candidatus Wallbacteria bacterium HGW-Wallbacteria-1 TaxID=2013854 RepID=A0A2N1PVF2_9BACT|nr:MAG: hypothetical protein CVV64_02585 [Candidatus Wallbacteria bacterium HGW-Wallbacteria-1]
MIVEKSRVSIAGIVLSLFFILMARVCEGAQGGAAIERVESVSFRLAQGVSPVVILILLAAVFISWKLYAALSGTLEKSRRLLFFGLRTAVLIIAAILLLQPVADMHVMVTVPSTVALLVDGSASMGIMDSFSPASREYTDRYRASWSWLRQTGVMKSLSAGMRVVPFIYSSSLEPIQANMNSSDMSVTLPFMPGGGSNPGGAILEARNRLKGSNLSAMIVISDGCRTIGPDPTLAARLAGVPVFTLGVGGSMDVADLAVKSVNFSDKAYVGVESTIDVTVTSRSLNTSSVPVILRSGQKELARSFMDLSGGQASAKLKFTPEVRGLMELSVQVPLQPGEMVAANNSRPVMIMVSESRTRVLLLSSVPSWDYKFLRQTLQEDPSITLSTMCLLRGKPLTQSSVMEGTESRRTQSDSEKIKNSENSENSGTGGGREIGIPLEWPVKSLDKLNGYEVIILVEPTGLDDMAEPLAQWVSDGGGLFAVGALFPGDGKSLLANLAVGSGKLSGGFSQGRTEGISAFANGRERTLGLEKLLPLLPSDTSGFSSWLQGSVRLAVTDAGSSHPFSRLVPGKIANTSFWREWPDLQEIQECATKTGSLCLVRGREPDKGPPVLAVHRFGRGRVAAMPVRGLWRYRFMMAGTGKGKTRFTEFLSSGLNWLRNEKGDALLTLQTDRLVSVQGEEISITANLMDSAFSPVDGANLRVTGNMEIQGMTGVADESIGSISLAGMGKGVYHGSFTPGAAGRYEITVVSESGQSASTVFVVTIPPEEFLKTSRDRVNLEGMAEISGGKAIELEQTGTLPEILPDKSSSYDTVREVQLWNKPLLMLLLMAILGVEWYLRRREGLE